MDRLVNRQGKTMIEFIVYFIGWLFIGLVVTTVYDIVCAVANMGRVRYWLTAAVLWPIGVLGIIYLIVMLIRGYRYRVTGFGQGIWYKVG